MTAALEQSGLAASAMPLVFAVFLSAVPDYGARAGLLFGFLLIVVLGIAAVAVARRDGVLHAMGGLATLLVFGVWLATSYATASWQTVAAFAVAFAAVFAATPFVADRLRRPLPDVGNHACVRRANPVVHDRGNRSHRAANRGAVDDLRGGLRDSRDRGVAGVHGRGCRAVLRGSVLRAGG